MTHANDDAVWAFFGHGREGAVLFYHSDTGEYSELVANTQIDALGGSVTREVLTYTPWQELHDLRLMVFAGCYTANDAAPGTLDDGNIGRVAVMRKYVDAIIAFQDLIYWPYMNTWADAFFTRLRFGDTVNQAADMAVDMVWYSTGWTAGTESWWTIGGANRIKPVGYGS